MDFTHDWFSHNIPRWEKLLQPLVGKSIRALEIGCFEGRATQWLLQNVLTHEDARITCCDTFEGAMEHREGRHAADFHEVERIFDYQVLVPFQGKVAKVKATSFEALTEFNRKTPTHLFQLVYIDGSHVAKDVMMDALLTWRLLEPGGILIFDDYAWDYYADPTLTPRIAIDAFLALFQHDLQILDKGYQVMVQRILVERAPGPPEAPEQKPATTGWGSSAMQWLEMRFMNRSG